MSFWQADENYRSMARLVASRKRQAEKKGNRKAALFLIEEFVNGADVIERADIPHYHRLAVRFVARAMREILSGKNPRAALCIDAEGRAAIPFTRDLAVALRVSAEYRKLQHRADKPLETAIKAVANSVKRPGLRSPAAMVDKAVKRFGGIRAVCTMADEMGYDPETGRKMRQELRNLSRKGKQTLK